MPDRVSDVMTAQAVSVPSSCSVTELERLLTRERIAGVAVVDDGNLVGIVSRTDIIRQLCLERVNSELIYDYFVDLSGFHDARNDTEVLDQVLAGAGERIDGLTVADVMNRTVVSVSPDASLQEAARLLVKHRFHRLPVVRDDRLLGIVSTFDIVRAVAGDPALASGTGGESGT